MENNDCVKNIVQSAGLEKPSVNFTLNVMDKIAREPILQPKANSLLQKKYYFFGIIPLVVLIYFVPSITDYLSKVTINYNSIDLSKPKVWLLNFSGSFDFSLSPAIISILLASFLLLGFFAMIQFNETENQEAV